MGTFWGMHKNIASFGDQIDSLTWLITIIILIWGLGALALTIFFSFKYRRQDGVKATYDKGEGSRIWVILLPVILVTLCDAVIDVKTASTWEAIKGPIPFSHKYQKDSKKPKADLEVNIIAQQFSWRFEYPGADGVLGTDDDITSYNEMHVPVDKNIVWHLTAPDVMHSFWVKNLRLKQDAIPGRWISGWFRVEKDLVGNVDWNKAIDGNAVWQAQDALRAAKKKMSGVEADEKKVEAAEKKIEQLLKDNLFYDFEGRLNPKKDGRLYEIACAEICGDGHWKMGAWMVVDSPEGFKKWLATKK